MLGLFSYLLAWWTALELDDAHEPDWALAAREARDELLTALMLAVAEAMVQALKRPLEEQVNPC